jgi:hypothetical protein
LFTKFYQTGTKNDSEQKSIKPNSWQKESIIPSIASLGVFGAKANALSESVGTLARFLCDIK